MSFSAAEEFVIYQILNTPMRDYPYPHLFVQDIFPPDFYNALLNNLPDLSAYISLAESGTISGNAELYKDRFITDIPGMKQRGAKGEQVTFWANMQAWMFSERFLKALLLKFNVAYRERFKNPEQVFRFSSDLRLVRDFHNYAIGPHTDQPYKVLSLLFYLPKDATYSHLGTTIYRHKNPNYSFLGGRHHDFTDFNKIFTAPYIPNSCLMFFKTAKSFHGVEPIKDENVERNVMLYNIYCSPVPEEVS